ncbi:MAG: membrane dipeptidase, partial [Oscillospiraceae bacterium]
MSICNFFDLHCDTACEIEKNKKNLFENDLQISLYNSKGIKKYVQTFAFWIDDCYNNNEAYQNFLKQYDYLTNQMQKYSEHICKYNLDNEPKKNTEINFFSKTKKFQDNKCNVIFSIEGGRVLGGKIENISRIKAKGISLLTLVWNGDNELGSGIRGSDNPLSDFGKQCVTELENQNIIVDVSHLNKKGFYDVCEKATKPFVATHSNASEIFLHKRNLDDDQLKQIIDRKGLVGINFYPQFINGKTDCNFQEILRHIDHILVKGGENILAIGSDFDGAPMPFDINNINKIPNFYQAVMESFGKNLAEKIFFYN